MKNKYVLISIATFVSIISFISFGLNIYFLTTKPKSASGIFDICKNSIVEVKAETESVGTSYVTAEIVYDDGTMITNAHVVTYTQLGETHTFENLYVRLVDEQDYRVAVILKYDSSLDIAVLKLENADRDISSINIGNSDKLNTGDNLYAIGNITNYGLSLTSGTISFPV